MTQQHAITGYHTSDIGPTIRFQGSMTACKREMARLKRYYKTTNRKVSGWCNKGFQVENYLVFEIRTEDEANQVCTIK